MRDGKATAREAARFVSTEADLSRLTKHQREVLQLLARSLR